jgi:trk system potassium uptake protein TrkA
MHVVVVGCGRVGSGLALSLTAEGHTVSIVDRNGRAFRRLPTEWEGGRVVGSGFDRDDLERAGAIGADALAAVTSGDNTNILTVRIARETYRIPRVVARIYDPRRAEIYQRLGIPTVATVTWTIDQVRRRLLPETVTGEWADASGKLLLVDRAMPEKWAGGSIPRSPICPRSITGSASRSCRPHGGSCRMARRALPMSAAKSSAVSSEEELKPCRASVNIPCPYRPGSRSRSWIRS